MWHFSGDWGPLPLVATADAPTLEPVEEGFQSGTGHCADLGVVPDDLLAWFCRCPRRRLHGDRISVPFFRASSPFGRSSGRSFDRSGPGRPSMALVPALGQPDLSLLLEGDDRLPDFERPQQARLCQEGKELCRGPTAFGEMPSKPGRDDRMAGCLKLPFLNLGEACAYVFGERAINCHAGHAVSRMPEPLEIGLASPIPWKDAG